MNEDGWIYAITRDLKIKNEEYEKLREEYERLKRENEKALNMLSQKEQELKTIKERVGVKVEIKLSRDGKQERTYCGVCGRYANRAHTFCYRCGTLLKWH